jgi:hypothetical protein
MKESPSLGPLKELFQKKHCCDLALLVIFAFYLILGFRIPYSIASVVDSVPGKLVVIAMIVGLFMCAHPIVAVVSLFVAFDFLRRSSLGTGLDAMTNFTPSEQNKFSQMTAFNQFPYTLEQEVVKNMAPLAGNAGSLASASYKPMLENQHHAASIMK